MSKELITLDDMKALKAMAEMFMQSGLFPDTKSVAQAMVKIQAGRELGMQPFEAMRSLNIINGQTAQTAGAIAAKIKGSGKYNFLITNHTDDACLIEFYEQGKLIGASHFDKNDAQAAGLLHKDMYKKYPRNMYFSRALTNGARWYCADVFGGAVYTPDELKDAKGEPIDITPPPQSLSNGGTWPTVNVVDKAKLEAKDNLLVGTLAAWGESLKEEAPIWDESSDGNPWWYKLEGQEVNGKTLPYAGRMLFEIPIEKLEKAVETKNAKWITEQDKRAIVAALICKNRKEGAGLEWLEEQQRNYEEKNSFMKDEIPDFNQEEK